MTGNMRLTGHIGIVSSFNHQRMMSPLSALTLLICVFEAAASAPFQSFTSDSQFDLVGSILTYRPSGSKYTFCSEERKGLPISTFEASPAFHSDESFSNAAEIQFPKGFEFEFFGISYDRLFLSSNGYITFGENENNAISSTEDLSNAPKISVLGMGLDPAQGKSSITTKRITEHLMVITFEQVESTSGDGGNTAQILLHCNGTIQVYYHEVAIGSNDMLVGLSSGTTVLPMTEHDLSGCVDELPDTVLPSPPPPPTSPPPPPPPTSSPPPATKAPVPPAAPSVSSVSFCGFQGCSVEGGKWCSTNELTCSFKCGGEWCKSLESPEPFCSYNNCISSGGGKWCGANSLACGSCGGKWCLSRQQVDVPIKSFCGYKNCLNKAGAFCQSSQNMCEGVCAGSWCSGQQ